VSERRSLIRDIAVSGVGTVIFRLVGAAGGVLAAHLLGPEGKGVAALLVLAGTVIGTLGTGGLQFWASRQVAASQPQGLRGVLRRQVRLVTIAVSVLSVGLAAWCTLFGTRSLTPGGALAMGALAWATAVSMMYLAVPNGERQMAAIAVITGLSGVTNLAWVGVLALMGLRSAPLVVLGAAVANAGMVPLCLRFTRKYRDDRELSAAVVRSQHTIAVRFGTPGAVGELLNLATLRLDFVLLAMFTTPAVVGLYAVVTSLTELLWLLPDAIAQVVLPHVAARPDSQDTGLLAAATVAATAFMGAVLVIFGRLLLRVVFGSEFVPASVGLPPLVVAAAALGLWKVLSADAVARGDSAIRAKSALCGLVVMLASDVLLIPHHGLRGAAVASAIGYSASALVVARRRSRTPIMGTV
jgi:O-antigen/teichoic acid export membrane protein